MKTTNGNRGQRGQGMTEYIIIVALVAVAAIAMVGFFGDTVRAQFYNMTAALAGSGNKSDASKYVSQAAKDVNGNKGMGNFKP
jgi:pilus assembly protein Flp/PilA